MYLCLFVINTLLYSQMALKPISNESDLLNKIVKGDEKAFEELFMAYHNPLGEYVEMFTQCNEMTQEIVQDVFLKVWTNRFKLNLIDKFTSYLFILTRNYTLNALRKTVNEQKYRTKYLTEMEVQDIFLAQEDRFDTDQDFQLLLDTAILQLPPQQQKVFLLRMQGFKNPEIAVKMGLATDSVKKYYKLALESIKKHTNDCETLVILCFILIQFGKFP
jgi:RNA polymerase sigma-70 factor (family 1)